MLKNDAGESAIRIGEPRYGRKKNCKTANQQGAKKKKKNCHMDITRNLEKFVNWEINYV